MESKNAPPEAFASIVEALRGELTRQQYETWFRRLKLLRIEDDGGHVFGVPNSFVRDWIDAYYRALLERTVAAVAGKPARVEVLVDATEPAPAPRRRAPAADAMPQTDRGTGTPRPEPGGEADDTGTSPGSSTGDPQEGSWGRVPRTVPAQPAPAPSWSRAPGRGKRRTHPSRREDGKRRHYEERFQLFGHPRYRNFRSDVILNDDYRFDSFVVGPSNQLPQAAAMAVANAPGNAYNPLFLHGAVGLGKTHLLQGICHKVLAKRPDARILYLSCETFVNQFIAAVEAGELTDFRYRYRHVDMLLIDDIHFLARKERTQEEFFHTFNTLYNSRKQIVLSCDSPPREIPTLEERLVSRFKWGLVAEVEQPDHETRISIVRRKASRRGVDIPEEICQLIADHVTTNVRELEGAVLRVIGYASLTNKPLTLDVATEALKDVIEPKERKVSIESILRVVSSHFAVKSSDLVGKRRHKSISLPRQVCMYLARRLTEYSLVEIGGQIGGRDHTTVIYANEKIARELQKQPRLREDLEIIIKRIRNGG